MKKILSILLTTLIFSQLSGAMMDPKVRTVPKDAMELVFKNPKEGLPLVVRHLAGKGNVNTGSVKAIHDWICDNIAYDSEMYFSGKAVKQDWESVLKKKKALCSGYTNLMTQMCTLAGIEAIGIEGYSKGFGYNGSLGKQPDHAWNAVHVNSKWQLIDVTWDAGYVDYKTFVKKYSTEWLYRSPSEFIYSHLPAKEEYQYLSEPKTKEQFVKEPYIPGIFFEYGLSLGKLAPDYANAISGETKFDFKLSREGISVGANLTEKDSGKVIQNAVWVDRIGSRISIDADIPQNKIYRIFISARIRSESSYPRHFSKNEFEGKILPQALQFLKENKITQKEYDCLEDSYFKVEENNRYYLAENLFATQRNASAAKILKMIFKDVAFSENVFYFDLIPEDGYSGFGEGYIRFPTEYRTYMETTNTHLVFPTGGIVKKGTTQKFEVESKDYAGIALGTGGNLIPFAKDPKTGLFSLETEIPSDCGQVTVFGSVNGKNYAGLWFYKTE